MNAAVDVRALTKRFGDFTAVNEISFSVKEGEIFGLLGPNGAGKSTLIRMLTTLMAPTAGGATVGGADIAKDSDTVRRTIGVIPQALTSDPELSVEENLVIFAQLYGVPREKRKRLITELLDVSRIESGRMEVHRQLVDVPDRARKIIAGRVAAGDAEDRFRLEVLEGLPETWLDADKIDQILGNLVENAVRHGAGIVTIVVEPTRLEGEDDPAAVAVSVRDQGEGISPDVAPRVFRQFWRGKPRGGSRRGQHGGGTGLGLYIVKGLVEAHGGTICVRRAPGGGAEFRFTVPAGTAAA